MALQPLVRDVLLRDGSTLRLRTSLSMRSNSGATADATTGSDPGQSWLWL